MISETDITGVIVSSPGVYFIPKDPAPARLLSYFCHLEKTLQCNCFFYGVPTPSARCWLDSVNTTDSVLQVTTTTHDFWVNSTINLLLEDPEIVMRLHCEGKNRYGTHTSSIFLLPGRSWSSKVFMKEIFQGIVYGAIITALLLFCLVLCVKKIFKWWESSLSSKSTEATALQKSELLEKKPEVSKEPKVARLKLSRGGRRTAHS